jgi:hypothetical protein
MRIMRGLPLAMMAWTMLYQPSFGQYAYPVYGYNGYPAYLPSTLPVYYPPYPYQNPYPPGYAWYGQPQITMQPVYQAPPVMMQPVATPYGSQVYRPVIQQATAPPYVGAPGYPACLPAGVPASQPSSTPLRTAAEPGTCQPAQQGASPTCPGDGTAPAAQRVPASPMTETHVGLAARAAPAAEVISAGFLTAAQGERSPAPETQTPGGTSDNQGKADAAAPVAPPTLAALAEAECANVHAEAPEHHQWMQLPTTLLWEPPLANQLQPHSFLKPTTLSNANTSATIDTAIGGTLGLVRRSPGDDPNVGFQQDFFAVVFSRWAEANTSVGVDYRFGFPMTFAWGNWQAKIAYEHTSSHLGDQFIIETGQVRHGHVRDEGVVGLAYRFWQEVRVYGIAGYAASDSTEIGSAKARFDWGLEWSRHRTTGWKGQPYAAFDMELRADQNYTPDLTGQIGWEWKNIDSRTALRVALEVYDGDSPYGEFTLNHEQWIGVGVFLDF